MHAAHWACDGSLKVPSGGKKLSRGNTFVVAAVVVHLPFLDRPVALPVLARLWRRGGTTKPALGRELAEHAAARATGILSPASSTRPVPPPGCPTSTRTNSATPWPPRRSTAA